MKPIKIQFRRDGIDFRQIRREGNAAVYELSKPIWSTCRYETVVILHHSPRRIGEVEIGASEGYPCTNQWGRLGWSYPDLACAKAKLQAIVEKQARKVA